MLEFKESALMKLLIEYQKIDLSQIDLKSRISNVLLEEISLSREHVVWY